jgi:addiction module RelE/StbE family toxin
MRINWSKRSLAELGQIADYIAKDNPTAAERVATRIFDRVMSLSSIAERGTPGRIHGTRETFILPWPYFVVYRIVGEEVRILHIRHTSRRWPA